MNGMVVTVTTSFLSKPSDLDVLGLSASADGNQVLLTIQDDGVVAYDVAHQVRRPAMNGTARIQHIRHVALVWQSDATNAATALTTLLHRHAPQHGWLAVPHPLAPQLCGVESIW